jgi:hypothetical protein
MSSSFVFLAFVLSHLAKATNLNCTDASIRNPSWIFSDYAYRAFPERIEGNYEASFWLLNIANGDYIRCRTGVESTEHSPGEGYWFCPSNDAGKDSTTETFFRIKDHSRLEVYQKWHCIDAVYTDL